jgi:hypothetical protein
MACRFYRLESRIQPSAPAQPGIAADRFARKILGFLVLHDLPEARLDIGLAHQACMIDNQAVVSC